ncbi:MAG: tetratricopeptide repeat protein [Bacteroidetes bacterium]|nr:tetratricopeptide repeat protein [Bacteroidota bacterium]
MKNILVAFILFFSCSLMAQTPTSITSILPEQHMADSLFSLGQWEQALPYYKKLMKQIPRSSLEWNRMGYCFHNLGYYAEAINCYQQSIANNPSAVLKPIVQSRVARIYALQKKYTKAAEWLDSAITSGYLNLNELESNPDFASLRSEPVYKKFHDTLYFRVYPCMADTNSRKFDFWVGEWDVYPNGANAIVGHSKIDIACGGCMILENWTSLTNAYNGKSFNFYSPETGKWEQYWIGSKGNPQRPNHFINGEYRDSAMRFVFSGKDQKGDFIGQFIFYNLGPGKVRQFNEQSYDNGKSWTTNYDLIYVRKK